MCGKRAPSLKRPEITKCEQRKTKIVENNRASTQSFYECPVVRDTGCGTMIATKEIMSHMQHVGARLVGWTVQ